MSRSLHLIKIWTIWSSGQILNIKKYFCSIRFVLRERGSEISSPWGFSHLDETSLQLNEDISRNCVSFTWWMVYTESKPVCLLSSCKILSPTLGIMLQLTSLKETPRDVMKSWFHTLCILLSDVIMCVHNVMLYITLFTEVQQMFVVCGWRNSIFYTVIFTDLVLLYYHKSVSSLSLSSSDAINIQIQTDKCLCFVLGNKNY